MKMSASKVAVVEVEGEGLIGLLQQRVTLFCMNYIYTGKLTGVNESCCLLEDAYIVYETGPFNDPEWKDAQKLPGNLYIKLKAVEAFGVVK